MAKEIPLTKGRVALVDDEDFERINQFKWYAQWNPKTKTFYAKRDAGGRKNKIRIYMHREILGLNKGDPRKADHREPSQTLDNRRANLRIATNSENTINGRTRRDNTSGFKGVCFEKRSQKWRAEIKAGGKKQCLGYFTSPEAAHAAYREAAKSFFGEFARP